MSGTVLRETAAQGDAGYLRELLTGGGNPCSTDENGLTPLHFATWNGHVECVEILVVNDLGYPSAPGKEELAKLRAKEDYEERLGLNHAGGSRVTEKREDAPEMIKARRRLEEAREAAEAGSTVIGGVAYAGRRRDADAEEKAEREREEAEALEKERSKPMVSCITLRTKAGWTPLHIAAMGAFNCVETATVLLLAGVDPRVKDENGHSAYDVAIRSRNVVCAALLRKQRPQFAARKRAMQAFRRQFELVEHPFRDPPPFFATFDGEFEPTAAELASDGDDASSDSEDDAGDGDVLAADDATRSSDSKTTTSKGDYSSKASLKRAKRSKKKADEAKALEDEANAKIVGGREDAKKFVAEEQAYDAAHKIRMAPPPRELLIPEHLILPYAKMNFTGGRGAHVIHNLLFAAEEAERNYERREAIARRQFEVMPTHVKEAKEKRLPSMSNRRTVVEGLGEATALAGGGTEARRPTNAKPR